MRLPQARQESERFISLVHASVIFPTILFCFMTYWCAFEINVGEFLAESNQNFLLNRNSKNLTESNLNPAESNHSGIIQTCWSSWYGTINSFVRFKLQARWRHRDPVDDNTKLEITSRPEICHRDASAFANIAHLKITYYMSCNLLFSGVHCTFQDMLHFQNSRNIYAWLRQK